MQSTWSESWTSSEFITTKIAFISRSVAVLQEKDLANRRPPMPSLITTLGGTIAAVCTRCRSQRNLRIRHGQAPDRALRGHRRPCNLGRVASPIRTNLVYGSDKGGRQGLHLGMWLPGHAR